MPTASQASLFKTGYQRSSSNNISKAAVSKPPNEGFSSNNLPKLRKISNRRSQVGKPQGLNSSYSYHITKTNITEFKVTSKGNGENEYGSIINKEILKQVPAVTRNVPYLVNSNDTIHGQKPTKSYVKKTKIEFYPISGNIGGTLSTKALPCSINASSEKEQNGFHNNISAGTTSGIVSQKPNGSDNMHIVDKTENAFLAQPKISSLPSTSIALVPNSLLTSSGFCISGGDRRAINDNNRMGADPGWANRSRTAVFEMWEQRGKVPSYIVTNFDKVRSRLKTDALNMANMQLTMPKKDIWRCLVAELIGTALLIIVGCGSGLTINEPKPLDLTGIGLCWGLTVATLAQTLGHVSGCHINPAVTLTMMVTGKIQLIKAGLYIIVQCIGAMIGALVLKALTPDSITDWGCTQLADKVTPLQGFGIEFVCTFVLLMVIFGVSDENRDDVKGSSPLAIGLTVTGLIYFGGPFTGMSLNPARSLGPAVVSGIWDNHWAYWIGPIAGAITAGTLYQQFFRALSIDEISAIQAEEDTKQRDNETKIKENPIPNV